MKKCILITAYAVHPKRGSEDGTGWNIIRSISEKHEVTAITRRNNQAAIDQYWEEHPAEKMTCSLQFYYYDLPSWLAWWKKGSRGALLYHYLWQIGVVFYILRQKFQFDIGHHLNFHCDWAPSFLWLTGRPVVWGPIGHHPAIPASYLSSTSIRFQLQEKLKWKLKQFAWRFDPFLWLSKRLSTVILGINSSVAPVLKLPEERVKVIPAVAAKLLGRVTPTNREQFTVFSTGRFVPLKGFDICIRAFAEFYGQLSTEEQAKTKFTIIGEGPEESNLQKLVDSLGLDRTALEILPWIPQNELHGYFNSSDLFFFPSHEGAGMVIPEAMAYGLPILCFDNYGPGETTGELSGIRIPYRSYDHSIQDFSEALTQLFHQTELRQQLGIAAQQRWQQNYTWQARAQQISSIYEKIEISVSNKHKILDLT